MKLPKAYEPNKYEPEIYALWETSGAFAPSGEGKPYSIVMPPPNANGNLHVGHGYMIPLQDILVRYHRMKGYDTVWIPGADHAGFETWVVFERSLEAEGKSRFDFSREKLYKMTWDFVHQQRGNMELQLRALGASCDWGSLVFTLDKKVVNTVYDTFKKLWNDGLVYRGERLVNYCTKHHTSFSDIEVLYDTVKTPLYYMKYGPFLLATTRPETKFGDTAVAVHPSDKRYTEWVGKTISVEGVNGTFEVQVIADEMVDPDFGTGVVKITPAHSFDDWETAERHNLPAISVIDHDGRMNKLAGPYEGLTVLEARKAVASKLEEMGLLIKVDHNYETRVGKCYKCGTIIEPMLMKQWFLKIQPLAQRAKAAIEKGEIRFNPAQKANELTKYFDELRDWNLSRQIPWGIPIPAFQNVEDPEDWLFDTRVEQSEIVVEGKTYRRDEDTFDTWFSSAQWPFVTTDYSSSGDLSRFYPNSVMETGFDILRPWVSRMIMMGLYVTDQVPFKDVYLHGLILDEHGQKMSKSKGNVINPIEVVEEFGSDALRLGVVMNRSAGQSQAFSPATVVAGRNFCNKLWNIARFIESKSTENMADPTLVASAVPSSPAEHWVISRLDDARRQINEHIANYRFAEAVDTIYHVIWDDVADWFIEASKQEANPSFLYKVLDTLLKLAHPFAPFVTEAIWTTLYEDQKPLMSQPWPEEITFDTSAADKFESVKELVIEARYILAQLPAGKYDLIYQNDPLISENSSLIKLLGNLKSVEQVASARGLHIPSLKQEAWLDISDEMIYEHQAQLELRLLETRKEISALENRLANQGYIERAPANLVEETRQGLTEKRDLEKRLVEQLGR